mmetsp:Transcript_14064/g.39969  ORF Transcript_14064/g.39969 Transcript_14064/m.39969 type:complete len:207 (+) Transcript_14064:598-1218(+)
MRWAWSTCRASAPSCGTCGRKENYKRSSCRYHPLARWSRGRLPTRSGEHRRGASLTTRSASGPTYRRRGRADWTFWKTPYRFSTRCRICVRACSPLKVISSGSFSPLSAPTGVVWRRRRTPRDRKLLSGISPSRTASFEKRRSIFTMYYTIIWKEKAPQSFWNRRGGLSRPSRPLSASSFSTPSLHAFVTSCKMSMPCACGAVTIR